MSTPEHSADVADIQVGMAFGNPTVKINRMPQVGTGAELAARIVAAFEQLTPEAIHPEYSAGYSG